MMMARARDMMVMVVGGDIRREYTNDIQGVFLATLVALHFTLVSK